MILEHGESCALNYVKREAEKEEYVPKLMYGPTQCVQFKCMV